MPSHNFDPFPSSRAEFTPSGPINGLFVDRDARSERRICHIYIRLLVRVSCLMYEFHESKTH